MERKNRNCPGNKKQTKNYKVNGKTGSFSRKIVIERDTNDAKLIHCLNRLSIPYSNGSFPYVLDVITGTRMRRQTRQNRFHKYIDKKKYMSLSEQRYRLHCVIYLLWSPFGVTMLLLSSSHRL